MEEFEYTISVDFGNGVDGSAFTEELREAGIRVKSCYVHEDDSDKITVVTNSAKALVDAVVSGHAGPGSLRVHKVKKFREINRRTQELIDRGFEYPTSSGKYFSLSTEARSRMIGVEVVRSDPALVYPIRCSTKNESDIVVLANQTDLHNFYLAGLMTYRSYVDSGTILKSQVRAAVTVEDVAAIVDDR